MSLWYVKTSENSNKIKKMFNIIETKMYEGKIFCSLPIDENTKIKKIITIARKLNRELYKNEIDTVVLSEKLQKLTVLKDELYYENIDILDGKRLSEYLIMEIIKYICNSQTRSLSEEQVSILVNENTDLSIENIIDIAKKIKRLNIVTKNIEKFKNIEEYLYNEFGIMIRVSNNPKKDLLNSDIILNIDFSKDILKKYTIPNKCVFVDVNDELKIKQKKFCGVIVNDYQINLPMDCKIAGFKNEIVYESYIYNKTIDDVRKQIITDNITIKYLLGKNGIIDNNEINKIVKENNLKNKI